MAAALVLSAATLSGVGWADEATADGPVSKVSGTVEGTTSRVESHPAADRAPSAPAGPTAPEAPADERTESTATAAQQQAECAGGECEGHDVEEPTEPDHAAGSVAEVSIAGNDLVEIGSTRAQVDDNGRAQGDVVVLAVGGQEVVGAHSDSAGNESGSQGAAVLCDETEGAVCLGLLFASTNSTRDQDSAHSDASTNLVFACVGGEQADPSDECTGAVGAGVSSSRSEIDKSSDGSGTAHQETDLADVCLGGRDPVLGTCTVGVSAAHAESTSTVDEDGNAETEHDSYLVALDLGGQQVVLDQPTGLAVPPGCPEGTSLVCLFINNWDEVIVEEGAGSRREVIHIDVLNDALEGTDLVLGHLGTAETFVHLAPFGRDGGPDGGPGGPGLAITGFGTILPMGLMALLALGAGGFLAWARRREGAA